MTGLDNNAARTGWSNLPAVMAPRPGLPVAKMNADQRKALHYPPNDHVVLITSRSKHAGRAEFVLANLAKRLRDALAPDMRMSDPIPSPLAKAHGQFRFQLLLRSPRIRALARLVQQTAKAMTFPDDVIVTWDVDAMSLM
jgi:primosomal protein N' (replication factor Y)